jgi:hypothetical protein
MKLEAYFAAYPEAAPDKEYLSGGQQRLGVVQAGMLQFTAETACHWGGPFPGNFAAYLITDQTKQPGANVGLPFSLAQERARVTIRRWLAGKPKDKARYLKFQNAIEAGDADIIHLVNEEGTQEHPFKLHVFGNDDCSYARWFQTQQEAEAFIDLLEAAQPLDCYEDFLVFNFAFTN